MEQAAGTGFERQQWTTGANHGEDDSRLLEVLDQGHQQKAPVASHNRGFLAAFGNSSYQILLPPNAPAAMMFNSSHTGLCSKKYCLQCVLTLSALTQQKAR